MLMLFILVNDQREHPSSSPPLYSACVRPSRKLNFSKKGNSTFVGVGSSQMDRERRESGTLARSGQDRVAHIQQHIAADRLVRRCGDRRPDEGSSRGEPPRWSLTTSSWGGGDAVPGRVPCGAVRVRDGGQCVSASSDGETPVRFVIYV